jgi:hypothetical protein
MSSDQKKSLVGGKIRVATLAAILGTSVSAEIVPQASDQMLDWKFCSAKLADDTEMDMPAEQRRQCVIAVARTYLQWAAGDLAAKDMPLAENFLRRRLGTARTEANTDRAAFMADKRPDVIDTVTEQEWFVDGDTAWAIFTVKLKQTPEDTHWIAERFTVTNGLLSDVLAVPPVVKQP